MMQAHPKLGEPETIMEDTTTELAATIRNAMTELHMRNLPKTAELIAGFVRLGVPSDSAAARAAVPLHAQIAEKQAGK